MDKEFFQVALPLMLTIFAGVWASIYANNKRLDDQSKRLDDLRADNNRRLDEMIKRFDEARIDNSKRFDEARIDNSKRFDEARIDNSKRFDEVITRLKSIEEAQRGHGDRLTRLEERTALVR